MHCFPTAIADSTCSGVGDLSDLLGWRFTKLSGMPYLVAIAAMHFPKSIGMVEVALGKGSIILPLWCRSGISSGNMDGNSLLLLGGVLRRLLLFIVL